MELSLSRTYLNLCNDFNNLLLQLIIFVLVFNQILYLHSVRYANFPTYKCGIELYINKS
jgi:hypothetical protein